LPVGSAAGGGTGRCLATRNAHGSGTACTTNGRGGRPGSQARRHHPNARHLAHWNRL